MILLERYDVRDDILMLTMQAVVAATNGLREGFLWYIGIL